MMAEEGFNFGCFFQEAALSYFINSGATQFFVYLDYSHFGLRGFTRSLFSFAVSCYVKQHIDTLLKSFPAYVLS